MDTADSAIAAAVAALAAGDVIGLPTETVYGLAADAGNPAAIEKIYRVKGRPADHPLIVHVLDAAGARRWADPADWSVDAQKLADAFWPGPLTMVLRRHPEAPPWACAGHPTIALRAPSHPVAREVMTRLLALGIDGIAAPSANRFGRVSLTQADHVRGDLGDAVAVVLDGGPAEVGIESTIVDLSRGRPVLLRPGHISRADLEGALGVAVALADEKLDQEAPRVPGALASHYAPRTPLQLVDRADLAAAVAAERAAGHRIALWSVAPVDPVLPVDPVDPDGQLAQPDDRLRWLCRPDQPAAMERVLYQGLRQLDAFGADRILVERPPAGPAWAAIADRLTRASAD